MSHAIPFDTALSRCTVAVLSSLFARGADPESAADHGQAFARWEDVHSRVREKIGAHLKSGASPRLVDVRGDALSLEDFPQQGEPIEARVCLPLLERLEQRVVQHPSAGQLTACLLEHLRYGIGVSSKLTPTQVRFVKSVCTLSNARPLPFDRIKDFILDHLDRPDLLREALNNYLQDKDSYLERLRIATRSGIASLRLPASPRIVVFGYASSLTALLTEIAASVTGRLHVHIADIQRPGRNPSPQEALRTALRAFDVTCEADGKLDELGRAGRFDLALAGSKILSLADRGELAATNSAPCVRFLLALRSYAPATPIVVTTALFKVTPAPYALKYQETVQRLSASRVALPDATLLGRDIAAVACELGWMTPDQFITHGTVRKLFADPDALDVSRLLVREAAFLHSGQPV